MSRKIVLGIIAILLCLNYFSAVSQTNAPFAKSRVITSLNAAKKRGIVNDKRYVQALVDEIIKNGVDFHISKLDEADLRSAGANNVIIEAIRDNYRGIKPPPTSTPKITSPSTSTPKITPPPTPPPEIISKTGNPLNLSEITIWLQKGISNNDLISAIQSRLVNFPLGEVDERKILSLGGDKELITTIKKSATAEVIAARYDSLIKDAEELIETDKFVDAESILTKAIEVDPSKSVAYRLRGEAALYKVTLNKARQYAEAEADMRGALKREGNASFRVFYVCGGKGLCSGRLFVDKYSFTFKSSDGPAWTIQDSQVVDMGLGTKDIKKENGGFWIATNIYEYDQKRKKKASKPNVYDFQAQTKAMGEANLIINIIKSY